MKKINNELNQAKCDLEKKCEDLTAEKAAVVFQVEELQQQVHQKSQEVQDLQQQREQCLALKHRYAAAFQQLRVACQQLKFENYTLHEQFAPQGLIGDQLKYTVAQTRVAADIAETDLVVTDTLCSGDSMVDQKSQEARDLEEQLHQCLTHLQRYEGCHPQLRAAYDRLRGEQEALHRQLVLQSQHVVLLQHSEAQAKMEAQRAQQELQEAQTQITMLEACVLELKELMEDVYHKCVLLSAESDSTGDYTAITQHQRASMKAHAIEKENCISVLKQEEEEMQIKLSARQQLGPRQEKKGWWKFFGSLLNTANQPTPGLPGTQDGSTSDQHGRTPGRHGPGESARPN
uniref:golgin subfamily A member 2-like n=1 Tax=Jaculus jaculus TaxID=51337 RepID=UPI001E1B0F14|nr:golgin subfamily A member 2-like [Jaculus jaculus]XP_044992226.1 golgin subfamily A member 2-like [Jaculus jaculus]XP_044992229.1 golgin subfamily A member 2-like [Jaculus jaculus]